MYVLPGGLFLALQFLILAVSSQKQSPWACLMDGEPCDQEVGQCCAGLSCHPTLGVCARCADLYQFCSRSKPCCEGTCRIVCT